MPSPFPGMDPFIEGQRWKGFHVSLLLAMRDLLVSALQPRYIVDVEEYVYVAKDNASLVRAFAPDILISEGEGEEWHESEKPIATTLAVAPVVRRLVMPAKLRQPYLSIRDRDGQGVVTVIELLSPWNKTGEGREEYINKRENIFATPAHLVEIDLLRGGRRIDTVEPLPTGDYFAIICRPTQLPDAEVIAWSLRERLPSIPIPLALGDADFELSLQSAFDDVYQRAGYGSSLKYQKRVTPALATEDEAWVQSMLNQAGKVSP